MLAFCCKQRVETLMNDSFGIHCAFIAAITAASSASPFATSVLSYDEGIGAVAGFTDSNTALGSAERFTGEGVFPSGVTPFNPAFGTDELVSVGAGGHLTLGFDRAITNDGSHAFGVDFIVFSNAGFIDTTWTDADPTNDGTGFTGSNPFIFGSGGAATIQVSVDGTEWITATTTMLDLFPTLGYSDYSEPSPLAEGLIESDFTQAMDPALSASDFANMSFAQLRDAYNGSGGGIGIDIASTGLSTANYVRFLNESGQAFEIDAVAVVPAPGALIALGMFGLIARRQRN